MKGPVPEADWKVFRRVRALALDAFCKRVLDEAGRFREDDGRSHHERYRNLFQWLRKQDRDMAHAFDDVRRSTMVTSLAVMVGLGLVGAEDLAGFSRSTREAVEVIASPDLS